jgi:hypothetical protein
MELNNQAAGRANSCFFDSETYTLYKRKDGIFQLFIKRSCTLELRHSQEIIQHIKKNKGPGKCLLLTFFDEGSSISRETRLYMASQEVSDILNASASVVKGMAQSILLNGYVKINKPTRPVNFFESPDTALKWLQKHKAQ